ncbi:related to protein CTF18 [Rhynchosporium graminicola]|uniref:Related to protein CTF18 n=1 Tax=Rhynchosporium graminicola TaxID=2792576 RepID=A0A1E1KSI6_9HELO|nr:related to protein CTF18 [Rhynchosporium commune]
MPSASSPVAYPHSSSPPPAKRSREDQPIIATKPKTVGGFLPEDDSDDEDDFSRAEPAAKRRMLDIGRSPSSGLQNNTLQRAFADEPESVIQHGGPVGGTLLEENDFAIPTTTTTTNMLITEAPETIEHIALPSFLSKVKTKTAEIVTCTGKSASVPQRKRGAAVPFEQMVAARSTVKAGRAKKSFYGIDIHALIDEASKETTKSKAKLPEDVLPSVETSALKGKSKRTLMWSEKYRARTFMELVGDDRTHRQVLKWLKSWDPLVFPKAGKAKSSGPKRPGMEEDEKLHKKILLLTGPPGLGKTTLAHVCARQAGYEVMEINASDERSKDVVKNRIRTSVGTESVKTGSTITSKSGHVQKAAHPLCVVVDEVDGVVGGSGGSGEGGFIKALIDLIQLDQKNSSGIQQNPGYTKKKKKGDDFRLMRPVILICNDVYHPSLRPLRQSSFAEIIHVRKPPLDAVVARMRSVFDKEGVPCDGDGVRRLCEATWGVSPTESRKGKESAGEGDLRGIMVVGEWAARKLKASKKDGTARLTRKWVEQNMTSDLAHGGGGARGVGRGGAKDLVNRVFLEGAGFPKQASTDAAPISISGEQPQAQLGVAEIAKRAGMERLREMVDTSGEIDRIVTDIWSQYPSQPFNDDSILSKPTSAYEWLHFHDSCSTRVFTAQEFELAPYLSQPVLACHHLFSSPARHYFANESKKWAKDDDEVEEEPLPFSGPRADYEAFEAERANRATILELQSSLDATLLRSFRSPEEIATDLLPYLVRMLTPDVKPIVVGGSGEQKGIASVRKEGEKAMVKRSVDVMGTVGVVFERGKLEGDFGNRAPTWVPLDTLVLFETASASAGAGAPVRYAVRQVLDQEYQKNIIVRENAARQARYKAGNPNDDIEFAIASKEHKGHRAIELIVAAKKDFFGREIKEDVFEAGKVLGEVDVNVNGGDGEGDGRKKGKAGKGKKDENKVWVTFHEGFSNAVRKPLTVEELLRGL